MDGHAAPMSYPRDASSGQLLRMLAAPEDHERLNLLETTLGDLARVDFAGAAALAGLSERTRDRLGAAFELARRRARQAATRDLAIGGAEDVAAYADPWMRDEPVEVFRVLMLDARHRVMAFPEVSRGSLTSSLVHPREVFRPAIAVGSAAVIVVHNHPSGESKPSPEDDAVTRRLVDAGVLLGIPVLDHVIIGDGEHRSYAQQGDLGRRN